MLLVSNIPQLVMFISKIEILNSTHCIYSQCIFDYTYEYNCVYISKHTYTHTRIYMHIYMYIIHIFMKPQKHSEIHTFNIHTFIDSHIHHLKIDTHTYKYMYMYMYIHIYNHIYGKFFTCFSHVL